MTEDEFTTRSGLTVFRRNYHDGSFVIVHEGNNYMGCAWIDESDSPESEVKLVIDSVPQRVGLVTAKKELSPP